MRKSLIVLSLFALGIGRVSFAWDGPDTVAGWIGPISPHGDTGHIEISDFHTQEQHSLNLVVGKAKPDSDYVSYSEFIRIKDLGGIELPKKIRIDARGDTTVPYYDFCFGLILTYKDTVWASYVPDSLVGVMFGINNQGWCTCTADSFFFSLGCIIQPSFLPDHPPPRRIDNIGFSVFDYDSGVPGIYYMDNLRFVYIEGTDTTDTLIDGMGDEMGIEEIISVQEQKLEVYPNPSFGNALIKYGVPEKANMTLRLYDISGRLVKTIYSGAQEKGYYEVDIKQDELKGGIYFIRFDTEDYKATRKLTILR